MGSLTHVCVWSSKGWTHIAPEEVARSHPGESVSARSGLFMCELCGQYALQSVFLDDISDNIKENSPKWCLLELLFVFFDCKWDIKPI